MALKIISGGQSGVDRAALDFAIRHDIPHGGFCPKGRRAEDGVLPARYKLTETESSIYAQRTAMNVQDADGVLIIVDKGRWGEGCKFTRESCLKFSKKYLVIDVSKARGWKSFQEWWVTCDIMVLNIAGNRESSSQGIYEKSFAFLEQILPLLQQ